MLGLGRIDSLVNLVHIWVQKWETQWNSAWVFFQGFMDVNLPAVFFNKSLIKLCFGYFVHNKTSLTRCLLIIKVDDYDNVSHDYNIASSKRNAT